MSEQITITVSLEQAEATIDAANCLDVAARGQVAEFHQAYVPSDGPDAAEANRYLLAMSRRAQEVAEMLRPEVKEAYKRDPLHQQMLHALKMYRKRHPAA